MNRNTYPDDLSSNEAEIIPLDTDRTIALNRFVLFRSSSRRVRVVITVCACLAGLILLVMVPGLFLPKKPLSVKPTLNSAPVVSIIVRQVAYTTFVDGSIAASNTSTGSFFWHRTIGVWGTPIVQDEAVYVNLRDGGVAALNTHDGSLKWKFQIPASPSSLLRVSQGHVFVRYERLRTFDGGVVVLQPNGLLLWQTSTFRFSHLVDGNEGIVYISKGDGVLEARRVLDGFLLWHIQRQGSLSLVEEKDVLYSWTQQGSLDALRARDGFVLWHIQEKRGILAVTLHSDRVVIKFLDGCGLIRRARDGSLLLANPAIRPICL